MAPELRSEVSGHTLATRTTVLLAEGTAFRDVTCDASLWVGQGEKLCFLTMGCPKDAQRRSEDKFFHRKCTKMARTVTWK